MISFDFRLHHHSLCSHSFFIRYNDWKEESTKLQLFRSVDYVYGCVSWSRYRLCVEITKKKDKVEYSKLSMYGIMI